MFAAQPAEIMDEKARGYWENIESEWARMATEWQTMRGAWLLGSANYVLRTAEGLWAVDPTLCLREPEDKILPRVKADLATLRFVLLSHLHRDHYSLPFLKELSAAGVPIAVPDWISEADLRELKDTGGQVILLSAGMHLRFGGVSVEVLSGWHYDFNRPEKGVPSLAFHVKTAEKTYLFPGDVRDFDHCRMPEGCDVMFGHVWLGRKRALLPKEETALAQYVRYIKRLRPKQLILAHLYDLHRKETDMWTYRHALWIADALREEPVQIAIPLPGERTEI